MSALSRCAASLRAPLTVRLFKFGALGVATVILLSALKGYSAGLVGRLEHVSVTRILVALGMCLVYRVVSTLR